MFSTEELRFRTIEMFVRITTHLPTTEADWTLIRQLIKFIQIGEMLYEIK